MNTVQQFLDGIGATRVGSGLGYRGWCSVHPDKVEGGNRSVEVDVKLDRFGQMNLLARCRSCGANGYDIATALGIGWPSIQYDIPAFVVEHLDDRPAMKRRWPMPSTTFVAEASARLLEGGVALDWLTEVRGISLNVIEQHRIGLDDKHRRILFPILLQPTADSVWLEPIVGNCLWYPLDPMADGRRKMCCWRGWHTSLYPAEPNTQWVLVTEGELDSLVALTHGIPAVSGTLGARGWEPDWTPPFAGRDVVLAYDCDDAGREGSEMVAAKLLPVARSVKVIDLAPNRDDGYDLTDWFRDGRTTEELKTLILAARHRTRPPTPTHRSRPTVASPARNQRGRA